MVLTDIPGFHQPYMYIDFCWLWK